MWPLKIIRSFLKKKRMVKFYRDFILENDLCYDIGANIGERTDIFIQLGAKVVVVEPQTSCFLILQNKCYKNNKTTLLNYAVGSQEKEDELLICDESTECSTLSSKFVSVYAQYSGLHWQKKEKIRVTTLDTIIKQYGIPKFIKIDVEGYESEVFKGLSSKINFIVFEFNRPLLNDTKLCLDRLEELGNCKCNFIKFEFMSLVLAEWLPIKEFKIQLEQLITEDILTGEIVVDFS